MRATSSLRRSRRFALGGLAVRRSLLSTALAARAVANTTTYGGATVDPVAALAKWNPLGYHVDDDRTMRFCERSSVESESIKPTAADGPRLKFAPPQTQDHLRIGGRLPIRIGGGDARTCASKFSATTSRRRRTARLRFAGVLVRASAPPVQATFRSRSASSNPTFARHYLAEINSGNGPAGFRIRGRDVQHLLCAQPPRPGPLRGRSRASKLRT